MRKALTRVEDQDLGEKSFFSAISININSPSSWKEKV